MSDIHLPRNLDGRKKKVFSLEIFIICIVAALCEALLAFFVSRVLRVPLFFDSAFKAAVCFYAGLLPAIFSSLLFSLLINPVVYNLLSQTPASIMMFTFAPFLLCMFAEIILVYLFHKKMIKQENDFFENHSISSFTKIAVLLAVLTALDCVVISIIGGIIDTIITAHASERIFSAEDTFKLGLLRSNMSFLAAAILSRIPINIVDRFIAVFGGFWLAFLYKKVRGRIIVKKKVL